MSGSKTPSLPRPFFQMVRDLLISLSHVSLIRQAPLMFRICDQSSALTETEKTGGRLSAINDQLSPSLREPKILPVLVPK